MFINSKFGSSRSRAAAGFTIVELVLFIVIVSAAVVGVLSVMNFTTSRSADPQIHKQALSIAEALMEEVSSAKFTFCDPTDPNAENATQASECTIPENAGQEAGGVSRPYDNVNDYVTNGYNDERPLPILDVNGANPGLANYQATILITPEMLGNIPATESLRIRIRVLYSNTEMVVLDGYRTRYAPNLLP